MELYGTGIPSSIGGLDHLGGQQDGVKASAIASIHEKLIAIRGIVSVGPAPGGRPAGQ
jgi:hypothetical protein